MNTTIGTFMAKRCSILFANSGKCTNTLTLHALNILFDVWLTPQARLCQHGRRRIQKSQTLRVHTSLLFGNILAMQWSLGVNRIVNLVYLHTPIKQITITLHQCLDSYRKALLRLKITHFKLIRLNGIPQVNYALCTDHRFFHCYAYFQLARPAIMWV